LAQPAEYPHAAAFNGLLAAPAFREVAAARHDRAIIPITPERIDARLS
jgi:hypothetical protein